MPSSHRPLAGRTQAVFYPMALPVDVQVILPKPCITILVHGVNDLAGVYADIEQGLCQGLNERLNHAHGARGWVNATALVAARYSLPTEADHLAKDPDKVYYRRLANNGKDKGQGNTRSVVIPFYWGFREDSDKDPKTKLPYVQKDTPHGEWLDRYGNRLDKAGTKEGGMFVNATTTVPDMWQQGFNGLLFGVLPMNTLVGSARHPLFTASPRHYMVLAARRLAMLITIIRAQHPDDTVNVVAHSQGTMLTLLANAFLKDDQQRPIDSAVLMNSPYSLVEPRMERTQLHAQQQTQGARRDTLGNIIRFIGEAPHPVPSLAQMADASDLDRCIGGRYWTGQQGTLAASPATISFEERDNRGHVTLYFTPLDQTVGLRNVQGIGWQGVPDAMLGQLGERFHQRLFTLRERHGQPEEVGTAPHRYVMRQAGEHTWDGNGQGWTGNFIKAELDIGQAVTLNAPALPQAFVVNFDGDGVVDAQSAAKAKDGIHMVKAAMDPIDASIAITNGGWNPGDRDTYKIDPPIDESEAFAKGRSASAVQEVLNEGKGAADRTQVKRVIVLGDGTVQVTRTETPSEARERLMKPKAGTLTKNDALSFHSAIPANAQHSRLAVAYDIAIGQARSIDDEAFYTYLCRIADWRLGWGEKKKYGSGIRPSEKLQAAQERSPFDDDGPDADTLAFYRNEAPDNKKLIDATADYRTNGKPEKYPEYFNPPLPSLVRSETRG